jgi:hypothetical protein
VTAGNGWSSLLEFDSPHFLKLLVSEAGNIWADFFKQMKHYRNLMAVDVDVDGSKILKWIVRKEGRVVWIVLVF